MQRRLRRWRQLELARPGAPRSGTEAPPKLCATDRRQKAPQSGAARRRRTAQSLRLIKRAELAETAAASTAVAVAGASASGRSDGRRRCQAELRLLFMRSVHRTELN